MQSLLIADPSERPHADQALEHSWLDKHKCDPSALSADMLKSMMRFMGASNLIRRCLLIIATRVGSPKMDKIGAVFLSIDDKQTGRIQREGLASSFNQVVSCWEAGVDIDDFFDVADQDGKDSIGFLEFAATCIWGADDTTNTIAERAFKALDDNHDGMVHLDECRHAFRDCDLLEFRTPDVNQAFDINTWRLALGGTDQLPTKRNQKAQGTMLERFIRTLICSEDNPGAEDDNEVICK